MITDFLLKSSQEFPNKDVLIFEDKQITYQDLFYNSSSLANSLIKKTKSNSVVSLLLPNSIDFVISYFGIIGSGNICHIIPPSISDSNLINQISVTEPSTILSNSVFKQKLIRTGLFEKHNFLDISSFEYDKTSEFSEKKESDSLGIILFSAGTTSSPKAITLSHNNIENTTNRIINYLSITNEDKDVISLPLSHSFGLGCLNCIIKAGGTAILHRNTINLPKIISSIKDFSATSFAGTPTTFQQIVENHKNHFEECIESIRYLLTNSAPMPKELIYQLLDILKEKKLYTYYGLTEASRSTFHLYKKSDTKISSVGKPLPEVKIKIVSEGKQCIPFEKGEVWIQGPHVTLGYWKNKSADQKLQNHWLLTGDIGYLDDEGYLFLVGRSDDMINIGGDKVFPQEIEEILGSIDEIEDVGVKGIPDKLLGQVVKAFIVLRKDAQLQEKDVIQFCSKKLENFKVPRQVVFLDDIPKNEQGKILRNKL